MLKVTLPLLLAVLQLVGASRPPAVDDLLSFKTAGEAAISPDGTRVAYTVREPDFKQDAYVTRLWVADAASGRTFQLTRGDKSATTPRWSPDGVWLGFVSNRVGEKNQVFAIPPDGGEAIQLTKSETAVSSFDWSPDGKTILYLAVDAPAQARKDRQEHLGDFEIVRKEYSYTHIWTFDVSEAMKEPATGKQRTKGKEFNATSAAWSPDGKRIAFSATADPDLTRSGTADIYVLNLSSDAVRKIVSQPGSDSGPRWSPDGQQVVFSSQMGKIDSAAYNTRLAVVSAEGGEVRSITGEHDEDARLVDWNAGGIYFSSQQKTAAHLFRVDPALGRIARISSPDNLMAGRFSFTHDGRRLAFSASSPTSFSEIFITDLRDFAPRQLTRITDQAKDFTFGTREVISWRSQDGAVIEGILIKPADFDPTRKYPLLCVIHGGPTGVDQPSLGPDAGVYPLDAWAARGALILKVNYRGSAGYGEKFRRLNIRNLGIGDAWDVLSGVDFLISKGWVDSAKVGCMGWSQGGYISAFLTTSSDRFAAISVGAGISNWATYYYNTDITQFTRLYLGADPIVDPAIYQRTSPMAYIGKARTPTLIQHGELDRRVPIPNAYELRQGLEDRGVKVEMVVYKGFGHGISKPRAQRAAMQHNLAWFNHYIFGDPLADFTNPELPKKEKQEGKP